MRIAIVLFPITSEGGLATRVAHTVRLLESFGHEVDFFRIRYADVLHRGGNGVLRVVPRGDSITVQQWNLSITSKSIKDTLAVLNGYQTIIFAHPCPHLSDKQYGVTHWHLLYEETKARKLTYFSDVYLEQFYPQILHVKGLFEPLAINEAVLTHVRQWLPTARLARAPFFNAIEKASGYARQTDVLWTPAWRSWKGINKLLDALPEMSELNCELFGNGREMRNARKQRPKLWGMPNLHIHGVRSPVDVETAYARSKLSLDLTGASAKYHGHVNRTHLEPMWAGCCSVMRRSMTWPHSAIPPECAVTLLDDDVAKTCRWLLNEPELMQTVASNACDWIHKECEPQRLMAQLALD